MNLALQNALLAGIFTWFMTLMGAAVVFLFPSFNRKLLDTSLGFAAGVMIAASFWSLLAPAIELSEGSSLPACLGFMLGGLFLWCIDKILPHLHYGLDISKAEGIKTNWRGSVLLVLAITLHNIPEGLAIGVAFGSAYDASQVWGLGSAIALAIGIGIQNLPEGIAVALPLQREGMSRLKSFMYGQLSGVVEPVSALIGCFAVIYARPLLPYALAFAAGAMIFVVIEELIPESQQGGNADIATLGTLSGFTVMMFLDVALS